jgi:hypothetical protein
VTDVTVTQMPPVGPEAYAAPTVEVVAGAEVRALVEHSEQVIQALQQELEVALREAEEAEQRVASHPAARLGPDRSDPTEQIAVTAPANGTAGAGPRTTVVSRPRAASAAADDSGAGQGSGYQHSASRPGLFTSHLVLKLGVVLAVLAVLLLLFA